MSKIIGMSLPVLSFNYRRLVVILLVLPAPLKRFKFLWDRTTLLFEVCMCCIGILYSILQTGEKTVLQNAHSVWSSHPQDTFLGPLQQIIAVFWAHSSKSLHGVLGPLQQIVAQFFGPLICSFEVFCG